MSDKPQITNLEEAKAALDEQIADVEHVANIYRRSVEREQVLLDKQEAALWRLKSLRNRMDPPTKPQLVAVQAEQVA